MIRETGDMWSVYDTTDYFIVTTNSYLRSDEALVMGRGIARQLKDKLPKVPYTFGSLIDHLGTYALVFINRPNACTLGAFQVKHHFADDATLALITMSTKTLAAFATQFKDYRYDINFPGIGNGGLAYDDVLPIIQTLPDNVHVWTFD